MEWELINKMNKDKVLSGANKLKCKKTVGQINWSIRKQWDNETIRAIRLPMKVLKVLRENWVMLLVGLFNLIINECKMWDVWRKSYF